MLIIAATPIGNLGDASTRLVEHLSTAEHIAAEDTRSLTKLAGLLGVKLKAKLYSLHEHNELERADQIVALALESDVLLVSDAGMPTVSDPGFALVRAAVAAGVEITVVPGPSAVLAALAVSGLATDRFTFEGFAPRKDAERKSVFEALVGETRTMVFFESPHRIGDTLAAAAQVFGPDRQATVSRELTKKFEHTERGTLADLVTWAAGSPKGEMVLIISGASPKTFDISQLGQKALELAASGMGLKQACADLAEATGASKSAIYAEALLHKP